MKKTDTTAKVLQSKGASLPETKAELMAKYPKLDWLRVGELSKAEVREKAEMLSFLEETASLIDKVKSIETQYIQLGRKLLLGILTEAYGLYTRIKSSDYSYETFQSIRDVLKSAFKISTHADAPDSTVLLKLLFKDTSDKTIHLYARSITLAHNYEVDPSGFEDFVKEMGGLEKIRAAYAKVNAADAGKKSGLDRRIDESASVNFLGRLPTIGTAQLTGRKANAFKNDSYGYCYVIAHVDMLNQLEVIAPIPNSEKLTGYVMESIAQAAGESLEWKEIRDNLAQRRFEHELASKREKNKKKKRK